MSQAIRDALKPPSDQHPADWISENVYVENSERGEKYDVLQTRWWRKIMGCYADHETTTMFCIMPTGSGKSTFFEGINCWIPAQSPGSTLYATQTDKSAKRWMKTRLRKTLEKCKALANLWPANLRNNATDELIVWINCFLSCGGAGEANLQEQSITYGQGDEGWTWTRGRIKDWLARGHNRENRKFCMVSQAGIIAPEDGNGETSELHQMHDLCRKWDFGWRCKSCGGAFPFTYEQLQYDEIKRNDGSIDDQASADTVRRVCPNPECGESYPDTVAVRRMLHDSLEENDGYICIYSNGQRGWEGFHLDRGGVWWFSWSYYVLKKLAADRQMKAGDHTGLMEWTMKDKAVGWSEAAMESKVELKTSGYTTGDYASHRKIDGEFLRVMALDVGGDHLWGVVRAWAQGGSSKQLWCGYIATPEQAEQKRIEYNVPANDCVVDVGFNQEEVAGWIVKYGWTGFKGDGSRKSWDWEIKLGPNKGKMEQRLYSKRWYALSKEKRRAECWHIAVESIQHILQRLITGQASEWLCPDDAPPTLLKHLANERLTTERDKRGKESLKWKRFGAQHLRDCEVYALARALQKRVFSKDDIDSE